MSPFLEEIIERPTQQKVGILVGGVFMLALIIWANVVSHRINERDELAEKIDGLNTEVQKERRLAMNRQKFEVEVADLDMKLERALHELPDSGEVPELLSSISSSAKEAGLEVVSFKVNTEQFEDFYSRLPVEITVSGSYQQVASFLSSVASLPRIVNISQIEMIEPTVQTSSATLRVNCIATTFRYLTPDEQQRIQAQVDSAKRR
jgi:type IV pilus assembly protein PilO